MRRATKVSCRELRLTKTDRNEIILRAIRKMQAVRTLVSTKAGNDKASGRHAFG